MDWLRSFPPWFALLGFFAAVASAAVTGSLSKPGAWYATLSKPAWTPANWVFPIAWTFLYVAMAVAVWWVALSDSPWVLPAITLWTWQLVLNTAWSPVFFGLRRLGAGLVVIAILWLVVALATVVFFQISAFSGWIMLIYLLWISYATALNLSIWRRNRGTRHRPL